MKMLYINTGNGCDLIATGNEKEQLILTAFLNLITNCPDTFTFHFLDLKGE
jgi:hypothetical protein